MDSWILVTPAALSTFSDMLFLAWRRADERSEFSRRLKERPHFKPVRQRNAHHGQGRDISLTPYNAAKVRSAEAVLYGEILLRDGVRLARK